MMYDGAAAARRRHVGTCLVEEEVGVDWALLRERHRAVLVHDEACRAVYEERGERAEQCDGGWKGIKGVCGWAGVEREWGEEETMGLFHEAGGWRRRSKRM